MQYAHKQTPRTLFFLNTNQTLLLTQFAHSLGDLDKLKRLLEDGGELLDLNIENVHGDAVLHNAVEGGLAPIPNPNCDCDLIQPQPQPAQRAPGSAHSHRSEPAVASLILHGADVNRPGRHAYTPLHISYVK